MTHLSEIPEQEEYIGLLLLIFQYIVQDAGAATTMGKKYYYTYCARAYLTIKKRAKFSSWLDFTAFLIYFETFFALIENWSILETRWKEKSAQKNF